MMDWEACESTVDQNIRIAFPNNRKRREYMLKRVAEIDALEQRKDEVGVRKHLMRNSLHDAVQLESEYEALAFELEE